MCETESSAVACTIDLEQRPRALELERELARPFAGAQRVRGADAERREPRELLRLGLLARAMEQLQDARRRPSQRQRGRDGAVPRQPGGVGADRPGSASVRSATSRAGARSAAAVDAPRGGGGQSPVFAALPEDGGRRPGDAGREPDDLGRGVLLLQRDRERLAGQLERRTRERGGVAAGREGTKDESGLRGAQLGGESLLRAERLAGAEQLERDGAAVHAGRHEEEARGPGVLGDAAYGGRRASEVVERRPGAARPPAARFRRARPRALGGAATATASSRSPPSSSARTSAISAPETVCAPSASARSASDALVRPRRRP